MARRRGGRGMGANSEIKRCQKNARELLRLAAETENSKTKDFLTECARDFRHWAELLQAAADRR